MVSSRVGIVEFHAVSVAIKIDLCHGSVFECLSYLLDDFLCIHVVCLVVAWWLAQPFPSLSDDCHVAFDFLVSSFLYAFVEVVSSELDLLFVGYKISVLVEDVSYSCVLALSHEVELI